MLHFLLDLVLFAFYIRNTVVSNIERGKSGVSCTGNTLIAVDRDRLYSELTQRGKRHCKTGCHAVCVCDHKTCLRIALTSNEIKLLHIRLRNEYWHI